jgi:DNA-binding NtrC family response regulator
VERPTPTDTEDTIAALSHAALSHRPGLLLVFSGGEPMLRTLPVGAGLTIGRGDLADDRLSRIHAEVRFVDGRWCVRDLDSRNGTFADGQRVAGTAAASLARVLRLAGSVFVPVNDLGPFEDFAARETLEEGTLVAGPALGRALAEIRQTARRGGSVLITGESGAGKELAARAFHASSPFATGPFVAVNCATIAPGLAERLLFGARRGAYSGADADSPGYIQASHRGVLFLDEIGELDLPVQAKLLRALELGVCWATHRDLRAAVAAGTFRADLYYRISGQQIALPPLRNRLEEIPPLVARALASVDRSLRAGGQLVEACLLRPWPGNVRELLGAVRAAAGRATAEASVRVCCHHLDPAAGQLIDRAGAAETGSADSGGTDLKSAVSDAEHRQIEKALGEANGNRALAARLLGISLRKLYYKLRIHGLR